MNRRKFIKSIGLVAAVPVVPLINSCNNKHSEPPRFDRMRPVLEKDPNMEYYSNWKRNPDVFRELCENYANRKKLY